MNQKVHAGFGPADGGSTAGKLVASAPSDWHLLGLIGPKSEAIEIKRKIGTFLHTLGLTMSGEKTLITHATDGRARFLGCDVYMAKGDGQQRNKRRSNRGLPMLSVPCDVTREWTSRYKRHGKPYHRQEFIYHSDYDIVMAYHLEFQGLVNYYKLAHDVAAKLYPVKWVAMQSLVKTLAAKHQRKATWVYSKYYRKQGNGHKALVVEVPRENRKALIAKFGAKPIRFDKWAVIEDTKTRLLTRRNDMVRRLLANQCELCRSTQDIVVHHIRKLKDLKRQYAGRSGPPAWVVRMIEMRRKTLVVCRQCHQTIHAGTYDGPRLK